MQAVKFLGTSLLPPFAEEPKQNFFDEEELAPLPPDFPSPKPLSNVSFPLALVASEEEVAAEDEDATAELELAAWELLDAAFELLDETVKGLELLLATGVVTTILN